MKIAALHLRAGHVIKINGELHLIIKAENLQPGKGAAITQIEMRRFSDGIKLTERYRTQEMVERAFIDEGTYQFLYDEGRFLIFMHTETYEQVEADRDLISDRIAFLQENILVTLKLHEGRLVAIDLPNKVVLEVKETEPVLKGQTAASSFKPAVLENNLRIMVPPHVRIGDRIVVSTADKLYVERSKD